MTSLFLKELSEHNMYVIENWHAPMSPVSMTGILGYSVYGLGGAIFNDPLGAELIHMYHFIVQLNTYHFSWNIHLIEKPVLCFFFLIWMPESTHAVFKIISIRNVEKKPEIPFLFPFWGQKAVKPSLDFFRSNFSNTQRMISTLGR